MALNLENKKQIATLLLAIGLGLVAVFLTSQYVENNLQKRAQAYKKDFEKKTIGPLVGEIGGLKQEIKKMAAAQASLAKRQQQQAKLVKAASTQKSRQPMQTKTLTDSSVFSVITPRGKRAFTISIDSLSAVGGLINPGDLVDIIAELTLPDKNNKKNTGEQVITSVLFQQIQILAVGTNFKPIGNALVYQAQQREAKLKVTLAVDPEQAGLLTFAQANGKLQLSLRPPTELGIKSLEVASWDALSEYVLESQGTRLAVPEKKSTVKSSDTEGDSDEIKPFIQIFRGGQEL
ncbi:hypothetical protein MNBD_UNCLBAC01-526 [hydrothermal vent metagenome]|uniref:Flp pilus assembly protein RcpC/CpaB domain-containing protein n=1 Tax=hydrothermal vent metagenome TaxID=652676 RepID=A0A3B1DF28_9ZZZZ